MRILHIISQLPDFTGSGKYIQAILTCAAKRGHDNFLVAGVQGNFSLDNRIIPFEKSMFVKFDSMDLPYPLPGMSDVMPYKSTIFSTFTESRLSGYEMAFKRVIQEAAEKFRPDIIHTHHLWLISAVTRDLLPDIPMVTTCHGTCLRQFSLCSTLGKRVSIGCRKIERIMALSNYQKEEIIRIHATPQEQIDVVGGGYDEALFHFEKKAPPPPVEILYAGKLSYSKGLPWLLSSLKQVAAYPWHLHIAGEGSGEERRRSLELAGGLDDKVTVHSTLSHNELAEIMRKAHLFILPSFFEGLPLVLMEAIASGCRVITTSLPGTREVLGDSDNSMVTLIPLPDLETVDRPYDRDLNHLEALLARAITGVIEQLLENYEPDLKTARKLTSNYTWKEIFSKIEKVYEKALIQTGSKGRL